MRGFIRALVALLVVQSACLAAGETWGLPLSVAQLSQMRVTRGLQLVLLGLNACLEGFGGAGAAGRPGIAGMEKATLQMPSVVDSTARPLRP